MADNVEQNVQSDQHVDTRDFRVKSISLIGSSGISVDITKLVNELQVRQDMYLGFMSAEMLVTDGIDLHTMLGLHGEEYVFLHIVVPEQSIELKKAFRIYKISDRVRVGNTAQRYMIYLVSDEMYASQTIRINKVYKDSTLPQIASEVMQNILNIPSKKIFINSDDNTARTVIVPNWRPLELLNWIASRGMTPHFFYETFEGFHFSSLKSIYSAGTKIKVPFFYENKRGAKNVDMDKFAIDAYEGKREFDILTTSMAGGHGMTLLAINPLDQSFTKTEYDLTRISTLYQNPVLTGKTYPQAQFLTYLGYDGIENWILRNMHLSVLNNSVTEIVIPGNMGVQIGSLINIRLPYMTNPSDGDMWDKVKSGRYLVIAANHKFDMTTHKHTTLVMLVRDSVPEALPTADRKLPEKVRGM